jgi:hypothetical protein
VLKMNKFYNRKRTGRCYFFVPGGGSSSGGGSGGVPSVSTTDIAVAGASAANQVSAMRNTIMTAVQGAAGAAATGGAATITTPSINSGAAIDISTGAGALVLDDKLQQLSTMEQSAAQLVAAENKGEKEVNSLARG